MSAHSSASDELDGRRVLIIQQTHSGHRLMYVRILVEEILRRGAVPIVALSIAGLASPEYRIHLAALERHYQFVALESARISAISELCIRVKADLTVLLEGDDYRFAVARRGWSISELVLLIMRPATQKTSLLQAPLVRTAVKGALQSIAELRKNVQVFTLISGTASIVGSKEVRDPISISGSPEDHAAIGARLGLRQDRKWFGIVGAVSQRKNPLLVLRAAQQVFTPHEGMLIAGRIDGTVDRTLLQKEIDALRSREIQVLVVDRLLDDVELDGVLANLHCVVLAHSNEGSSGIFGKALALGTNILSAGALSLREDSATNPSAIWVTLEEEDIVGGLKHMVSADRSIDNGIALNSADSFAKLLTRGTAT